MTGNIRLLFVDDEPAARISWSTILTNEGFQVTVASTVAEALALITAEKYDALIADLNVGQPGDGFTIVSAMRRVQPQAVTLILTGYPAFQAALRAIHEQVDDFLTKPADPQKVVTCIQRNLSRDKRSMTLLPERLSKIIAQNVQGMIEAWYKAVEKDPEISQIPLSREQRIDHLPEVLEELVYPRQSSNEINPLARASSARHGAQRRIQKYSLSMLLQETRILHRVIADYTQENLLMVDISNVLPDLVDVHDRLHLMLKYSLEAFLQNDSFPEAA